MSSSSNQIDAHNPNHLLIEDPDEEPISDHFICCVCLDLLYKPIVLACGHISCFWCVHRSMDPLRASHCPICRNPYHHFPTICEMVHFLIVKMYPLAFKRREKQILEEEKKMGCFSPQLDGVGFELHRVANSTSNMLSAPCITDQDEDSSKVSMEGSAASKQNIQPASDDDRTCRKVMSADLLCPACKQLLYRPVVLNCGHVYCDACILVPEDGVVICKVCEIPHPCESPNVCLELSKFLEEQFPEEYAKRIENVELKEARFQHKNSSSGSGSKKSSGKKQCIDNEDLSSWSHLGSKVHIAAGCDYCGMFPIAGDRYKCKDCVETIGFDLCGDCYNTQSKRPGRFNQQHTQDHQFELLKPPDNPFNDLMLRLVQGNLVNSSGAPVLAISTDGDLSDGWIAVEPTAALQSIDVSVVPDSSNGDDMHNEAQDGSAHGEYNVASETASDYGLSHALHNLEGEDSSSDAL